MRRAFTTLITEIEAEETLLSELYDGLRVEAEINWNKEGKIEEKVENLLGDCSESFTRTAQSVKETIEELKETLGIGQNGEILNRSLFGRLKLIWAEADLDKLIARLRRSNERLLAMVNICQKKVTREPRSRKTKQAIMLGVARNLLRTACNALSDAMTCACAEPHNMNLQVETYSSQLLRNGEVEELAKQPSLALGRDVIEKEIAQDKLRDVREVNEYSYLAIKYCINLEVVGTECNLESQEFRKEVYERVVGRFEDNLDGNI
ncbi:hypothetical protein PG990_010000 [Apiospora arundinis]